MAITVKDIQEKEFSIQATGGYNIEQVDDFLDAIADQMSDQSNALTRENLALSGQINKLNEELATKVVALGEAEARVQKAEAKVRETEAKLPDYNEKGYFKNLESAIRESLIAAQRIADETIANAKVEAERLVSEAQANADVILSEAQASADALATAATQKADEAKAEADAMKATSDAYRASLRKMVEEHMQTLGMSGFIAPDSDEVVE